MKKDTWDLFRDLLREICKTFPAEDTSKNGRFVRVGCSWESQESNSVSVSLKGFLFLEEAEAAMKSTEQKLELVVVDHLRFRLLSAVGSRMARQQGYVDTMVPWHQPGTRVVVRSNIQCGSKKSALDVSSVLKNCQIVDLGGLLHVAGDIGREGWTALREALQSEQLHDIPQLDSCCKGYVTCARREDLRAIWRCLSLSWKFSGDQEVFEKQRGEEGWSALEQFLDLTNAEWRAEKVAMGGLQPQVLFVNGQEVSLPRTSMAPVDPPVDMGPVAVLVALEYMEGGQG